MFCVWKKVERNNEVQRKKQTKAVYLISVSSNQTSVCAEKWTREIPLKQAHALPLGLALRSHTHNFPFRRRSRPGYGLGLPTITRERWQGCEGHGPQTRLEEATPTSQAGGSKGNTAPSTGRTRGLPPAPVPSEGPPPSPPALGAGGKAEAEQGDPASQMSKLGSRSPSKRQGTRHMQCRFPAVRQLSVRSLLRRAKV